MAACIPAFPTAALKLWNRRINDKKAYVQSGLGYKGRFFLEAFSFHKPLLNKSDRMDAVNNNLKSWRKITAGRKARLF